MNLYLLKQKEYTGYDTYDSMVIAAENETDAKHLSFIEAQMIVDFKPNTCYYSQEPVWRTCYKYMGDYSYIGSWSENPTIELISESTNQQEGIVCASFNAG
jgi:hypothetical protein